MRRAAPARRDARRGLRRARGGARRRRRGRHRHGAARLSEILIRPAVPADADEIGRILVASWRAGYAGLVDDEILAGLDESERADQWRDIVPDADVLVAEADDGGLAGVVSLAAPARDLGEPATGEVTVLYVDAAHWRRGIGRALMDAAGAELRDEGCEEVVVWCFEANAGGRAFYATLGFAPDGGRQLVEGLGLPEVRLRARLDWPRAGSGSPKP